LYIYIYISISIYLYLYVYIYILIYRYRWLLRTLTYTHTQHITHTISNSSCTLLRTYLSSFSSSPSLSYFLVLKTITIINIMNGIWSHVSFWSEPHALQIIHTVNTLKHTCVSYSCTFVWIMHSLYCMLVCIRGG